MPVNGTLDARRASSTSGSCISSGAFVFVQQEWASRPDRDRVPPMQKGASFNLDAVKSRSLQP